MGFGIEGNVLKIMKQNAFSFEFMSKKELIVSSVLKKGGKNLDNFSYIQFKKEEDEKFVYEVNCVFDEKGNDYELLIYGK